jgi:secondary thiamine-phosphate synthase enzyme
MERIGLKTYSRTGLVDITAEVQRIVDKSKISDGICFVFCPHTTAGLTINENADALVKKDITDTLNKLIPENAGYAHTEGNSDGHIKSSLFGSSVNIFIESGRLALGSWQGIYFCESDGPRMREVWVKIARSS